MTAKFPSQLIDIAEEFESGVAHGVKPHQFIEAFTTRIGMDPFFPWQKRYFDRVFDRSNLCHKEAVIGWGGCRKSSSNAMIILWLMILAPLQHPVRIRVMGPTGDSTEMITLNETKTLIEKLGLEHCFFSNSDFIGFAGDRNNTLGFVEVKRIPMDAIRHDSLRGFHSTGVMAMFFDEAIRYPEVIYHACAGNMNPVNATGRRLWLINSNAVIGSGYFVDQIFGSEDTDWALTKEPIDNLEDENVKQQIIANAKATYGFNTPMYRAMLYCEFPVAVSGSIFTSEVLQRVSRSKGEGISKGIRPVLAVDVAAGVGNDLSSICIRDRHSILEWTVFDGQVPQLRKLIYNKVLEYDIQKVIIDACGLGLAIACDLEDMRLFELIRFMGHHKPGDKSFVNARSEVFWLAAKWLREPQSNGRIPPGVRNLMLKIKTQYTDAGLIGITCKDELRKSSGAQGSLDLLDAFVMTFSPKIFFDSAVPMYERGRRGIKVRYKSKISL